MPPATVIPNCATALGSEATFRQEFFCSFESLEGLVYTDFARCVAAGPGR